MKPKAACLIVFALITPAALAVNPRPSMYQ